ncbi:putative ribonuclease H-like domain-containing protein [Tanacetum coccineum]|uniref:Ribonuclease H-like domain-containing protein n=1 Tax=Tanacetum coccineum TaxID=301880 RepID=A0ABQ4XZ15_9ASTR
MEEGGQWSMSPPGFEDPDFPDRVYKVEKALYGLHQAPRAWYETLSTYLLDNEFQRGKINKTLFIKRYKGDILLVQVYVDDIIFGSTKKELCNAFEKLMHEKFQMSSMGELTFFLGLQVDRKNDEVKTASTPIETQKPLLKDEDGEEVDVHMYRSMIGSLMYLTSSRPDIMFAVCACARYQVNPKVSHLHDVKRIFRYLKGQPKLGLWYPKDSPFDLVAYTDSDYARATLDRKSTTGGCQFLGCRLISWQCKKQTVVALIPTQKADLLTKAFDSVWNGIGVNAGDSKLMLLGINLILLVKVNADRHNLLLLVKVNAARHNLLLLVKVNAARHNLLLLVKVNAARHNLLLLGYYCWFKLQLLRVKTVNGEVQLQALVDGKKIIITESTIKRDLQLEDVEGVDCLPNATIFEQLTLMSLLDKQLEGMPTHNRIYIAPSHTKKIFRKMRRVGKGFSGKEIPLFQTMVVQPQEQMGEDEAVYKELDDSLVRAATTSSSLEAKQDNGGGPRRQETMGDTIAKTRVFRILEHKDIKEMKFTQVGLSARVESFGDEKDLGEDASKQGMIADIDDDARITLVSTHFDVDTDMFGVHDLAGDEVVIESEVVVKACEKRNVEEVVDVAQVSTAATTETITTEEITLAQALAELKSAKKVKGIVFQEPGESITITTTVSSKDKGKGIMVEEPVKMKKKDQIIEEQQELSVKEKAKLFQQLLEKRRKHFAAKRAKEQRNKPPTKAQQKKTMITYLKNMEVWKHKDLRSKDFDSIKELFDKALKRVNIFVDFRTELVEGSSKRAGTERNKRGSRIDAIPLATKPPSIVD